MVDWTAAGDVAAGSEEVLHYVRDALGSVVGLLDAGEPDATPEPVPAKLVERYDYDPYGKTYIAHWDPAAGSGSGDWVRHAPDEPSAFGNPFMWTGQRHDVAIGLYHFPFRTYSPRLGRWLQRDPLGYVDGVNMYAYAGSSPTNLIDPLGLHRWYKGMGHTHIVVGPVDGYYYRIEFTPLSGPVLTVLAAFLSWNVGTVAEVWVYVTTPPDLDDPPDRMSDERTDMALVRMLLANNYFYYHVLLRNCDSFARWFLDYGLVSGKDIPPDYYDPLPTGFDPSWPYWWINLLMSHLRDMPDDLRWFLGDETILKIYLDWVYNRYGHYPYFAIPAEEPLRFLDYYFGPYGPGRGYGPDGMGPPDPSADVCGPREDYIYAVR